MDPEETGSAAPEGSASEVEPSSPTAGNEPRETSATQPQESPYANDPEIQKFVSDRISTALKHIPKEYREEAKFKELLGAREYLGRLQQDPRFQAYRKALEGGGEQRKPSARDRIAQALAQNYQLQDGGKFVGDLTDQILQAVRDDILPEHMRPVQEYMGNQTVERELQAAKTKYPDFEEHNEAIRAVIDQYQGNISFEHAYQIATHGKTAARNAEVEEEGVVETEQRKRAARTERPTGHGAGEISQKRPKNAKDAKEQALRDLRARGLLT